MVRIKGILNGTIYSKHTRLVLKTQLKLPELFGQDSLYTFTN